MPLRAVFFGLLFRVCDVAWPSAGRQPLGFQIMKQLRLSRFSSTIAAVAVGLASALPLAKAAEEGPESFVTTPLKALEEKNPKLIWDMLPASYQKDLNGLVQTFAKEMDAELWDAGFELVGGIGELLTEKKELIAEMLSEMDESGEVPMSVITSGLEMALSLIHISEPTRPY